MFDNVGTGVPADLESIPPGPKLGAALAALDWDRLSDHDLVRVLRAQERQVAHYKAGSLWTMNQIVHRYENLAEDDAVLAGEAAKGAAAEIGAALRLTRRSSEVETSLAVALNQRLPQVWTALLRGQIDLRRAMAIADNTLHIDTAAAQQVATTVLPDAGMLTTGQLNHRLRKLCADVDPEDAKRRYETSLEDRRVVVEANPSGTANLLGLDLPPHVVEAVKRRIHKEAIRLRRHGDTRTIDQLRADILLDLLSRRGAGVAGSDRGGVHLTGDLVSLAGLSEASGDLNGFGPVIADIARQIAQGQHDAPWDFTITDPDTGMPVATGTTRRRPTRSQQRQVHARNPVCVHPGCRMPAVDCDIDHTTPYDECRRTCTGNLAPLCRHHHMIRHTWHWSYERLGNGGHLFRSPLGHPYLTVGEATSSGRPP
jgi:hypothetical protein